MQPEDLPLAGTVVLDFSQFLAGPVAALRLADLGARVIKVERPHTGEIGRTLAFAGRTAAGDTLSFHAMNRNKEAVVADLKDPADLARVKALVARADVVIENFRPGVMERIGLDYPSVRELNPGLVYASASGYGDAGPWANRPGQDLLAQAVSGATWLAGADRPMTIGLSLADHLMSCHLAEGVSALLVRRARTGRGGRVETSLLEGVLDLQATLLTRPEDEDVAQRRTQQRNPQRPSQCPASMSVWTPAGIFATKDGYVALSGAPLDELAAALGDEELAALAAAGSWEQRSDRVSELIAATLQSDTTDNWLDSLPADEGAGRWVAPVLTLEELLASPEFAALEMTQQVERSAAEPGGDPVLLTTTRSPIRIDGEILRHRRGAPRLGEQGALREGADPLGGDRHDR